MQKSVQTIVISIETHIQPTGDRHFDDLVARNTVHGPARQEVLRILSSTQDLEKYRDRGRGKRCPVDLEETGCNVLSLYN